MRADGKPLLAVLVMFICLRIMFDLAYALGAS